VSRESFSSHWMISQACDLRKFRMLMVLRWADYLGGDRRVAGNFKRWSGRQDLNLRRPGPKPGALPG
jgi:hypothetical protein